MEKPTHHLTVGAFVLVTFIGIALAALWFFQKEERGGAKYYDAFFQGSVSGLREGSSVRYRGVPVGSVRDVRIDPNNVEQVRVRMSIHAQTPIKEDAAASLEIQGLTGLSYVQISGGTQASPMRVAKNNEEHPVIPAEASQIERVFSSAPEIMANVGELMIEIRKLFTPENRAATSQLIRNLADLSKAFSDQRGELAKLVSQTNKSLLHFNTTMESLSIHLNVLGEDAHQTFSLMNTVLKENRGAVKNFTGIGLDQLTKLMGELRSSVAGMNRIFDRVERSPSRFLFGDGDGTVKTH